VQRAIRARVAKFRMMFLATLAAAASVVALVALSAPAGAVTTTHATSGQIHKAFQYRSGRIRLTGYAFDRYHQHRHPAICIVINTRCVRVVRPDGLSRKYDRLHHIVGAHRFALTLRVRRPGVPIAIRQRGNRHHRLDRTHALSPGKRIVRVARHHLDARYRWGGSSPRTGFDCSGYTMYSYRHGRTAALPHNAEAQRHSRHMHRIRRRHAHPGDLVFYMRGGSAYHVAIYAGHGYQYSATDPQEDVRYQRISSRNVLFGTDWHH
jgi:NlpC/P60 family